MLDSANPQPHKLRRYDTSQRSGDEPVTNVRGYLLLRLRRGSPKNELRIRCLTSADPARRLPIPVEFNPCLNKQCGRCSLGLCNRNGTRGSLPHSLCLASDRSLPWVPPKSRAWTAQPNGTRIGPPTLGVRRLAAKRPRRRRRERLQGYKTPF